MFSSSRTRSPRYVFQGSAQRTLINGGKRSRPSFTPIIWRAGFRNSPGQGQTEWRSYFQRPNIKIDPQLNPIIAGVSGGVISLLGVYLWYHLSNTSKVIQSARQFVEDYEAVKDKLQQAKQSVSPKEALYFVKDMARKYKDYLPRDTVETINKMGKQVDELSDKHGKELEEIMNNMHIELVHVISKGGVNNETAKQIANILQRRSQQLASLTGHVGNKVLKRNPELGEAMPNASETMMELKRLGEEYGPEVKKVVDKLWDELDALLMSSDGFMDPVAIYKATQLIRKQTEEARKLARKASEDAWEKLKSQFNQSGYLDGLPKEVRGVFEKNVDELKRYATSTTAHTKGLKGINKLWDDIRSFIKPSTDWTNPNTVERFIEFIEDKVREGRGMTGGGKAWDDTVVFLEEYIRAMPGGDRVLESIPHVDEMVILVTDQSPEARKLTEETFKDLAEVLEKRLGEGKRIVEERKHKNGNDGQNMHGGMKKYGTW